MSHRPAPATRSVPALVEALDAGETPAFVTFWNPEPSPDGALGPGCLSQWWPSPFVSLGERFATAEHSMMWRKARLFGDDASARAVLAATTPAEAKAIGREVAGYDHDTWAAHRWELVVAGSVAKFASDPGLRGYLMGTAGSVLVEASPEDRIWGIGLGADDPAVEDPARWPGMNLFGFALMEARERLG